MLFDFKNTLKKHWDKFSKCFYSFKGFLFTIIILFISVNTLDYKDSIFTFNLSNLKYLYLNPFTFSADKSEIFFSLVTVLGLWFAFKQLLISNEQSKSGNLQLEIYNKQLVELSASTKININQLKELIEQTKTAKEHFTLETKKQEDFEKTTQYFILNGLVDELKHNINLSNIWIKFEEEKFYNQIYSKLSSQNDFIYPEFDPNPDFKIYGLIPNSYEILTIDKMFKILKLRNEFLQIVLNDKSIFNVLNSRIYLNLRHFNYSVIKYNECVDNFNNSVDYVKKIRLSGNSIHPDVLNLQINDDFLIVQNMYKQTVFLRLNYLIIDLVTSMDENNFIDKEFTNKLLKIISKEK